LIFSNVAPFSLLFGHRLAMN